MLKKAHRLSTKQFMEVMEKGRIITSPLFVVRVIQSQGLPSGSTLARSGGISAVAPKKVAATAVVRNKVRRQIYEAVRPLKSNITPGVSMIIFAKNEATKATSEEMKSDLRQLFLKSKISV